MDSINSKTIYRPGGFRRVNFLSDLTMARGQEWYERNLSSILYAIDACTQFDSKRVHRQIHSNAKFCFFYIKCGI